MEPGQPAFRRSTRVLAPPFGSVRPLYVCLHVVASLSPPFRSVGPGPWSTHRVSITFQQYRSSIQPTVDRIIVKETGGERVVWWCSTATPAAAAAASACGGTERGERGGGDRHHSRACGHCPDSGNQAQRRCKSENDPVRSTTSTGRAEPAIGAPWHRRPSALRTCGCRRHSSPHFSAPPNNLFRLARADTTERGYQCAVDIEDRCDAWKEFTFPPRFLAFLRHGKANQLCFKKKKGQPTVSQQQHGRMIAGSTSRILAQC